MMFYIVSEMVRMLICGRGKNGYQTMDRYNLCRVLSIVANFMTSNTTVVPLLRDHLKKHQKNSLSKGVVSH